MNDAMLEILIYLFKNHVSNTLDFLVNIDSLSLELQQAGFDFNEIDRAFQWLDVIFEQPHEHYANFSNSKGMRVFHDLEAKKLTKASRSLLYFLEHSGMIGARTRELIIDRAMALESNIVDVEQLRWVIMLAMLNSTAQENILMWIQNAGEEPLPSFDEAIEMQ